MSGGGVRAKDELVITDLKKFARVAKSIVIRGQDAYPNVSWRGLRGMRNRIAHDYDGINDAIFWAALLRDVRRLIEQLNAGDRA